MTDLTTGLGLTVPIIQAPMAGVSTPTLAAAVSNAGGMGSLGLGASDAATAARLIEDTRALTDRPFGINFFCHAPALRDTAVEAAWCARMGPLFDRFGADAPGQLHKIYQSFVTDTDMQRVVLEAPPALVSFHFGLPPAAFLSALKGRGHRCHGDIRGRSPADCPGRH